ncbi:MAG: 50S ribosomal protein L10 [Alphaproteobacteria bacterium]|nr:50S ribosomal protein L10 [Alphaproteobacteria bacterium]
MNRTDKIELVEQLSTRLAETPFVVFADYRGITVPQVTEFRRRIRETGGEYQVIKNTLLRRAVEGTDKEGVGPYLSGMTGVVFSGEDAIATAKSLRELTKDLVKEEKFVIKGGWFEGIALKPTEVAKVADLPSREELLSLLLRTLQEGPRQVLGVIQAPGRDLLYLLKNYERKLEESAG